MDILKLKRRKHEPEGPEVCGEARVTMDQGGAGGAHNRAEGAQNLGGADGLTGQGWVMALESWGDARGSVSQSFSGGEKTRGRAKELDGDEELGESAVEHLSLGVLA